MPSPFPGMNPYLEQESVWQDFHSTYIPTLRELLNASVAPNYFVKVEEYVFIHELPADQRRPIGRADVAVGSRHPSVGDTGQVKVQPAPFRTREHRPHQRPRMLPERLQFLRPSGGPLPPDHLRSRPHTRVPRHIERWQ